jgi:hypothetical protein
MKQLAALALAFGCLSARLAAQERDLLPGQRIRVETKEGWRWTGRVLDATEDAIAIELDDDAGSFSFSRADLTGIETGERRSRSKAAWSRAKWGAFIGGASGLTLGFQHEQVGESGTSFGKAAALGAWSGGLLGGLIGAAIGALNPGEEWVKIHPRVQPGRRNPEISLSISFEF